MKNNLIILYILFITLLTFSFSCTEPTTLGSELVDPADVEYTDTVTLLMRTIREDTIKTYDPNPSDQFSNYSCGNYVDPIFGTTSASIFTQLLPSTTLIPATFYGAELDSVVLHLAYDTLGHYGNQDESYSISVYRMTDSMDIGAIYYSYNQFTYDETMPLGSKDFTPSYDSVQVINYSDTSQIKTELTKVAPQLRITLDPVFGEEFLAQDTFISTAAFLRYLMGIHVKATSENGGMLSFSLRSAATGITVYYTNPLDEVNRSYTFSPFPSVQVAAKTTFIESEFSSALNAAFDNTAVGDSILYIQGLAGPNIRFDIPYAESFRNTIINKAELILTVASEEDDLRATPPQIIAATRDEEGTYRLSDDSAFAFARGTFDVFGGQLEENNGIREYRFNLSAAFQNLADGENEPLYLRLLSKQTFSNRMALFGPGHHQYPAKLNLIYTRIAE